MRSGLRCNIAIPLEALRASLIGICFCVIFDVDVRKGQKLTSSAHLDARCKPINDFGDRLNTPPTSLAVTVSHTPPIWRRPSVGNEAPLSHLMTSCALTHPSGSPALFWGDLSENDKYFKVSRFFESQVLSFGYDFCQCLTSRILPYVPPPPAK